MTWSDALASLAEPAPQLADAVIENVLLEQYGLRGTWRGLLSERDQNFHVRSEAGDEYVLKVANAAEDIATTELQVRVLEHLESKQCEVATPRVIPTRNGDSLTQVIDDEISYHCRLVTFVPGVPQSSGVLSEAFAEHLGQSSAQLLAALADFDFTIERQPLLWDIQQSSQLRQLLEHVVEPELHDACRRAIDDFDANVAPVLAELQSQTIHGDLNPDNVMAEDTDRVAGVIDFGDMVFAPRVCEVAVTATYQRGDDADPLQYIRAYLRGFRRHDSLSKTEATLLFDLIRARLTASITIIRWRQAERGDQDEYSRRNLRAERSAETFLTNLDDFGRRRAEEEICQALRI